MNVSSEYWTGRGRMSILWSCAGLLLFLVGLICLGPSVREPGGHEIQVVARKIIVYAGIATIAAVAHVLGRRRSG